MNEPEPDLSLYGNLSALNFALENLYALVLQRLGATPEDVRATRDDLLRQFEDLPPTNPEVVEQTEAHFLIHQHGVHRLERLFAAVEERIGQAGPRL